MVKPGDIDASIKQGDIEAVIARGQTFAARWLKGNDPDWMDAGICAFTVALRMGEAKGPQVAQKTYTRVLEILKPLAEIEKARRRG